MMKIKGFTLLETLVTVLIFTFIVGGMYGVLLLAKTNYDTNLVSLNLQRQARQGMSWLSREIRQASWASISISSPDVNGNNSITFNTPDANGIKYSVIKTQVSADKTLWQLIRTYPAGSVKIRADVRVDDKYNPDMTGSLIFSQGSGNILNIQIKANKTFSSVGQTRTLTFTLTEQVKVRN